MTSSTWIQSVTETETLRMSGDAPPEACVFRRGDLVALVYCDVEPPNLWHLVIAVQRGRRTPQIDEILQARETLLPGIENFAVLAGIGRSKHQWLGAVPMAHIVQIPDDSDPETRQ